MAKQLDSISPKSTPAPGVPQDAALPEKPVTQPEAPTPEKPAQPAEPAREVKTDEPAPEKSTPEKPQPPTPETPDATPAASDDFAGLFPQPTAVVSGPPAWVWWILLVVGAVGLSYLAFDLFRGRIDTWLTVPNAQVSSSPTQSPPTDQSPTPSPEATSTPTPTPTPTPTTSITKSSITLRVLNGTTTAGAAASLKTKLEAAGFTVKSIGNAKTQNYTKTYVYYQAGKQVEGQMVLDALADSTAILEESTLASPDNVLVVYGK